MLCLLNSQSYLDSLQNKTFPYVRVNGAIKNTDLEASLPGFTFWLYIVNLVTCLWLSFLVYTMELKTASISHGCFED